MAEGIGGEWQLTQLQNQCTAWGCARGRRGGGVVERTGEGGERELSGKVRRRGKVGMAAAPARVRHVPGTCNVQVLFSGLPSRYAHERTRSTRHCGGKMVAKQRLGNTAARRS